ncbi:MAG: DUF4105 domain-containing protein [Proteiniphilum sp.]|nr:DUF4105 domain-containing protein [Proteiniphilum sp.]MDD3909190.1 DUF4105 domain-containing protein [Proteiniphilum sp.]MDD4415195.1 DUF4105 domain-containing protein [Proteiniphilum sp.]
MNRKIFSILAFLTVLFPLPVKAQVQLSDSAKISMLTASEWNGAVYALFGHTALRVSDDSTGVNAVYNYGFFDSSQPNFIYNFVLGRTDYILGFTTFEDFLFEYEYRGQEVVEQELNLSAEEKQQLYDALYINALPQNRGYRYNYFYDNCATRPRDMVEKFTDGKIKYQPASQNQSFRDLVHESLEKHPWLKFGIDLIIGSDADVTIGVREKMFIPAYLKNSFEEALILKNDTSDYPLVKNTKILLHNNSEINKIGEESLYSPIVVAFAILFLTISVSLIQIIKLNITKIPKIYDTAIFGIAGLGGLVLSVTIFFSEHPATSPNWNFVWLNIFALAAAILFWAKSANRTVYIYHFINFALLTVFLLLWLFIPQHLPVATIPFSMSLWFRSGTHLFMRRRKMLKDKRFSSSRELKAGWGL